MMIVTAVLGIGFIFALAGDFVLWAKLDEQKKATAEEYNRRWDEISRAVGLEKQLDCAANAYEHVAGTYITMSAYIDIVKQERDDLQDRLSALFCPHNDHVWKDGVCAKCGMVKDAND